ncbi:MAG: hypothetical protein OEZ06_25835 [Myxococcales bacterium]|nr:hypothetical protein [Myxococcales bacterium]
MPLALCALLLGCAHGPPAKVPPPEQTSDAFFAAVRDDDPAAAYALLDPELQAELTRERFDAQWRDSRKELLQWQMAVARRDVEAKARARVELENGEEVVLRLEQGAWRLEGGILDAQAGATPLDTVAALRRALRRQSLPALLALLSRERRAAWQAAFEESLAATEDPLDLRVEIKGDEAIVHLSGGGEVHLKKEAGRWRIWDLR